jgi:peroxiredoxin Q/BCP
MSTQAAEGSIKVGDLAPDFALPKAVDGAERLKDFQGKKSVVLYFYPKDETPGCTAEACAFRDSYEDFKDAGAEVIGVSSDSEESHQQFASHHRLPFVLISDPDSALRKLYGVPSEDTPQYGPIPGRVTYVIDKQGVVRLVFSSVFSPQQHITEALTIVKASSN